MHPSLQHPGISCNNDAMTLAPKNVVAVRMDGVEDVQFKALNVYNMYESEVMPVKNQG